MMLGFLVTGIVLAAPPVGGAGALASSGEALGVARVTGVEVHAEYERYALQQPDGTIVLAELTTGEGGLCDAGGLTIFPRPDLAGGATATLGMDELCARLTARRPTLRARIGPVGAPDGIAGGPPGVSGGGDGPGGDGSGAGEPVVDLDAPRVASPLHAVLLALAALVVARGAGRGRPDGMLLGVGLVALVVRLLAAPRGITNGALAGYEKLVLARGTLEAAPYGEAWGALLGVVPGWPVGVFWATLAFATLSAPLLAAVVRSVAGARAGLAAGLMLALLPTHVGVSASENMHVYVLAFELLAVLAAGAWGRRRALSDGLIAVLATGVAVHLRPDALPFCVVPVIWAAMSASSEASSSGTGRIARSPLVYIGVPLFVMLALVGWRVATLANAPGAGLTPPRLTGFLPRFGAPANEHTFLLFLHAGLTPPVLWGLALLGAAAGWRAGRRGLLAAAGAWLVVTNVPVASKVFPLVDAIRLQLPGQAPWIVLAALGASVLPRWALPLALAAFLPYFPVRPWVQTEEWRFLAEVVPSLPAGTTVRYDARPHRSGVFAAVVGSLGPARWSATEGELRYVGLGCAMVGGCDTSGCIAERVTRLEGRADLDLPLSDADRTIGFWRCPPDAPDEPAAGNPADAPGVR